MGVITDGGGAGQLGTVGLAAVGAWFGGSFGASVGWLIGSWLFGEDQEEKNVIIDPGAQELPRFNQALRGATIAVLFGTNRVPAHITWQNNWNFIRHETTESTGGGGKAGGSGGAKGGGGKETTVSYEYKWDLIYHLGMTPRPYSLFNIWLGPEKVNPASVIPTAQSNTSIEFLGGNLAMFFGDFDQPGAFLSYDNSFYSPGYDTANESFAGGNWDHFSEVIGLPHRFPSTIYIGYEQLNLGSISSVPQLTFEVGPGKLDLTFDSAYINQFDSPSGTHDHFIGQALCDAHGKRYYFAYSTGGGAGSLFQLETGLITDAISDADVDALATAAGLDPGSNYTFTSNTGGATLLRDFVLLWGTHNGSGSRTNWAFVLCRIGADGTLTGVGGWGVRSNDIGSIINHPLRLAVSADQEDGDALLFSHSNVRGSLHEMQMQVLPSINDMLDVVIDDDTNYKMDSNTVNFAAQVGSYFGEHQSHRQYEAFGWFVPSLFYFPFNLPPWLGGIKITQTRYYFYIGKADIEADNDTPSAGDANSHVNSNKAAHPDGWFGYIELGEIKFNISFNATNPVICDRSEFVLPVDDIPILNSNDGLPDAGRNLDLTIDDNDDYLPAPFVGELEGDVDEFDNDIEAVFIVILSKSFTGSEDLGVPGTQNKVRFLLYNSYNNLYIQHATGNGSTFDTVSDGGSSEGNRYIYTPRDQMVIADQGNRILYEIRTQTSGTPAFDDDVVTSKFGTYTIGGGDDVPVPYIIKEILSSPVFGMGLPRSVIDTASYEAALTYCIDEGFVVSTMYAREKTALSHIELLLSIYGGFLIDSGGVIKFGIQDLASDPIRVIDNDHLIAGDNGAAPITITRVGRQQSYNKVKINYIDRKLEYKQNHVEINDEVDQDLYGIRAREFPPQFVMNEALANKIAIRTLWGNLYAKNLYDFKLGPKDADLEPGDVITLVDSFHDELRGGQRVRIVMWGDIGPMNFQVKAVKELAYVNQATLAINSSTNPTRQQLTGPSLAPAAFRMYELPQEFQGANPALYVGWNQLQIAMGADLYLSADGTSFAKAATVEPFIISGMMPDALPVRDPGYVEENVEVYLFPDTRSTGVQTGFTTVSPLYVQTHALDDVGAAARGLGGGTVIINSEAMAYQDITLIAQNHYRFGKLFRGWGGTHIHGHSSGDLWHKHGGGVFVHGFNQDKIGTVIHYKVAPFNFARQAYDIASIVANTYQIQGTYFRPQVPGPIATFVESGITITDSDNIGGLQFKHVHSLGTSVFFQWPDSARQKGYGVGGYGTGLYGRFETDTTSHGWRVEVLSGGDPDTVVRCLTVDSGWFVYSLNINSTDFNGWTGNFGIRVTPFNDLGDALRNRVKTLKLFPEA